MAQPKEEKPPTAQEYKFATMYVRFKDIYKAAERAKIARNQAVRVFNKPAVQEEIERQMAVVRQERAVQQVKEEVLSNELLDRELVNLIRSEKTGDGLKLDGIRLGYVATGRIQAGNTRVLDTPTSPQDAAIPFQPFVPMGVAVRPLMGPEDKGGGAFESAPPGTANSGAVQAKPDQPIAQEPRNAGTKNSDSIQTVKVPTAPKPAGQPDSERKSAPGTTLRLG